MKLVSIIDSYENRVDDKRRERLSNLHVIGSLPNVPKLEDLIKEYITNPEFNWRKSYVCSVRVKDQSGSPVYNRTELIDLNKCEQHADQKDGYSYEAANTGSCFVRPNGLVVNTQSGHRNTLLYAVTLNPDARSLQNVKFHDPNATDDQIITREADDHHTDCADRKPQTGDDKFKSAYYAPRDWAVKLFNYLKPFDISIAGTLDGAYFSLPSHSYMSTALKLVGEGTVSRYLKVFTKYKCEKVILGNTVIAGCLFLQGFSEYIAKVDEDNDKDSFDLMMKFYFTEYGDLMRIVDPDSKNLNQSDLIAGNNLWKGNEPAVARFVFLYNDFIRMKRFTISRRQKTAIPFEGADDKGWNEFLSNAHPLMKPSLGQLATTKFF
tara:strand:- start:28 stop:1164 length:1137 start_codon:yes stop_codon:yes gene_type:complete